MIDLILILIVVILIIDNKITMNRTWKQKHDSDFEHNYIQWLKDEYKYERR